MKKYERELIDTGAVVEFKILNSNVAPCIDGEEAHATADLMLLDEDDDKGYDTVEWGAFGFIFTLANLAFKDAAPRGGSKNDYVEDSYVRLEDMMRCLEFKRGTLQFYCDYLHGRLVKTNITIHQDGRVETSTFCRGSALMTWLRLLQGKNQLEAVGTESK
jgi:hypothetical protein